MKALKVVGLWICVFLFISRVLEQRYVGLYDHGGILQYVPSWEYWYSGLMPYPFLLIAQILIIQLLTLMAYDYSRQGGFFFITSLKVQRIVRSLAVFYFVSMMVRFLWFDENHFIPILFHCVLAVFLFIYSFPGKRDAGS